MTGDIFFELTKYIEVHSRQTFAKMKVCSVMFEDNIQECIDEREDSFSSRVMFEDNVQEFIDEHKEEDTFSSRMLKHIDESGGSDSEVYKKAGIDRRHFSKMRNREYRPSKQTAIALCMALELCKEDMEDMLELTGYSLSKSNTSDLVIMFCLEKKIYNIIQINELLDYMGCKVIGG